MRPEMNLKWHIEPVHESRNEWNHKWRNKKRRQNIMQYLTHHTKLKENCDKMCQEKIQQNALGMQEKYAR